MSNLYSKNYLSVGLILAVLSIQGCSSSLQTISSATPAPKLTTNTDLGFEPAPTATPEAVPPTALTFNLADKAVTALDYRYYSGTVSPAYQFSYSYKIDFQLKTVQVQVSKGESVTTALPSAGTRSLTDTQLTQIRNLFAQMPVSYCNNKTSPLGGPTAGLFIYTNSLTAFDSYVATTACTNTTGAKNSFEATAAASQQLVDLILSF